MVEATARAETESTSDYQARKLSRRCTRDGCKRQARDDSQLCTKHLRRKKQTDSEWINRKRAERRAAGLCIWCPGSNPAPATPDSTACLPCRIKRRRIKVSDGGVGGVVGRSAAIAAATSRDMTGPNGRVRYRGQQKRGQQPKWQLNLQDVRHVRRDFETFEQAIKMLAEPAARQMHASDRERAERETAGVGESMTRRTGDILERLGHFQQRHGPRPGESARPTADPEDDDTLTYKRASDAARIAAAARAGLYVYAPPLDVTSGRRETGKDPKPPDLDPLRRGLAERGLGLADEGAFYWVIVTRDGE